MLSILRRQRIVARSDRVFASEPTIPSLNGQFPTALVLKHAFRGIHRVLLGRMEA